MNIIKKIQSIFFKKKYREKNKLLINNIKLDAFIKRKKKIKIKINFLSNFKLLGNNSYYILFISIISILIIYILFGPIFRIKNIEIIKKDSITNMTISYNAISIYRGKSIFSVEKNNILKRLKNYQQNIKEIDTQIILPDTLKIVIDSHNGVFNTNINNKNYIITENGVLVPSNNSKELLNLNVITNIEKNYFLDYKILFKSEYINKIQLLIDGLKDNILGLNIVNINFYVTEKEVHIKINNNIILIFDLTKKINEQVEKLSIFNKDHLKLNTNDLIYIDLRIRNKIFYCLKEKKEQCNSNLKNIYPK